MADQMTVAQRRARVSDRWAKGASVPCLSEKEGVCERTIRRDLRDIVTKAVASLEDETVKAHIAKTDIQINTLLKKAWELLDRAEKEGNWVGVGIAMDKIARAVHLRITNLSKGGVYEGDQSQTNIFIGLKPQEKYENFKDHIDASPGDAQAMYDYMHFVKRLRPSIEGEVLEIEDKKS